MVAVNSQSCSTTISTTMARMPVEDGSLRCARDECERRGHVVRSSTPVAKTQPSRTSSVDARQRPPRRPGERPSGARDRTCRGGRGSAAGRARPPASPGTSGGCTAGRRRRTSRSLSAHQEPGLAGGRIVEQQRAADRQVGDPRDLAARRLPVGAPQPGSWPGSRTARRRTPGSVSTRNFTNSRRATYCVLRPRRSESPAATSAARPSGVRPAQGRLLGIAAAHVRRLLDIELASSGSLQARCGAVRCSNGAVTSTAVRRTLWAPSC